MPGVLGKKGLSYQHQLVRRTNYNSYVQGVQPISYTEMIPMFCVNSDDKNLFFFFVKGLTEVKNLSYIGLENKNKLIININASS